MNLQSKLRERKYDQIWNSYCGFLDLNLDEFMSIQNRLMMEQIETWSSSFLGKSILNGRIPQSIDDFRKMVPLTTYDDYADVLLQKKADTLPENPVIWIQTTWEGGKHPIKVAPYTRSMLDVYKNNVTACLLLSTSKAKGHFDVTESDKILYGLAPLPYATGILPLLLNEEIDIEFLPAVKDAEDMSFSERNKLGFKLAMKGGVDYFFGLGSVVFAISRSFGELNSKSSGGISSLLKCKPKMIYRILRGKYISKKENRPLIPKDIFKLKGFMVAGTDNKCYKDDLEALWGIRPMEIFAGTEPTVIGTETWTRSGMYFFPDSCFYEFISEKDMYKNLENSNDQPSTYLMDEVIPGEKYELVISVLKGGAFARYRVGDMYRCVGLTNKEDDTRIPRFEYIDRVPNIIDIAGFTRISKNGIENAMQLSGLKVVNWTAKKAYNDKNKPYMHLLVEMEKDSLINGAVNTEIIKDILTTYFSYLDQDYRDLKKILGMDPLVVTILKCGTFSNYYDIHNKEITKINANHFEIMELMEAQEFQRSERRVI